MEEFKGLLADDAFLVGWFTVHKIKGQRKLKAKNAEGPAENS